jgi:hypothetical protein
MKLITLTVPIALETRHGVTQAQVLVADMPDHEDRGGMHELSVYSFIGISHSCMVTLPEPVTICVTASVIAAVQEMRG